MLDPNGKRPSRAPAAEAPARGTEGRPASRDGPASAHRVQRPVRVGGPLRGRRARCGWRRCPAGCGSPRGAAAARARRARCWRSRTCPACSPRRRRRALLAARGATRGAREPRPALTARARAAPASCGGAARRAPRRRAGAGRALDHAPGPRLGAAGGAGDAAAQALRSGCAEGRLASGRRAQPVRATSDYADVPLTLVTGPANAAKAGDVLGGLRARARRGADPGGARLRRTSSTPSASWPSAARSSARACCASTGCSARSAARAGYRARVASDVQRELIVEEAVRRARLELLAESAAQPGFVRAAARLRRRAGALDGRAGALHPARCAPGPARARGALRGGGRGDLPRLPRRARGRRAGRRELFAWRALDALRTEPAGWGATPVFVYGFDDFTPLELDALETLAGRCGADVTVSLPFERGREAFKAVAQRCTRSCSRWAAEELALAPLDDHYAPRSRAALHHLERGLFEDDAGQPVDAGRARSRSIPPAASAPRSSWRRARCSSCCATASSRATSPWCCATRALLVAARAGLRRLRHPVLDRPLAAVRAHRPRARACSR